MFSEKPKKGKSTLELVNQQNTIAKGTTITGDIISDGDFRVEGTILGNVQTPGKVVLGKTGIINGTLKGANADIEGKFSGKLILTDTLSLKSSAFVEGEVEVAQELGRDQDPRPGSDALQTAQLQAMEVCGPAGCADTDCQDGRGSRDRPGRTDPVRTAERASHRGRNDRALHAEEHRFHAAAADLALHRPG